VRGKEADPEIFFGWHNPRISKHPHPNSEAPADKETHSRVPTPTSTSSTQLFCKTNHFLLPGLTTRQEHLVSVIYYTPYCTIPHTCFLFGPVTSFALPFQVNAGPDKLNSPQFSVPYFPTRDLISNQISSTKSNYQVPLFITASWKRTDRVRECAYA